MVLIWHVLEPQSPHICDLRGFLHSQPPCVDPGPHYLYDLVILANPSRRGPIDGTLLKKMECLWLPILYFCDTCYQITKLLLLGSREDQTG